MQSEIDDIRADLRAMTNLVCQDLLDIDSVTDLINRIGQNLQLIELQQASPTVVMNVYRLSDLAPATRRPHLHVVVEGERA